MSVGLIGMLVLMGCGSSTLTPGVIASEPAQASDAQGAIRLGFDMPRTSYRVGEPIEGRVSLSAVGGVPIDFGSSGGGPFVFEFEQLGGRLHVGGAITGDCAPYRLKPGEPLSSGITKSGGYSPDDPDAAFYRAFLDGRPTVTLPAGDWRITARASLVEGQGCGGAGRELAAPIVIHVLP